MLKQIMIALLFTGAASAQADITLSGGSSLVITSSMAGTTISCGTPTAPPASTPLLEVRKVGYYYYAVQPTTGMSLGVGFGDFPETLAYLRRAVQNVVGRNACINFDGDHWAVTDIYTGIKRNSNPNSLDQCIVELYATP
jgi:hypothetical protein